MDATDNRRQEPLWRRLAYALLAFILIATAGMALAFSPDWNPNPYRILLPTTLVISLLRRDHPIGGWLMYFLIQCFVLLLRAVITLRSNIHTYLPGSWHDPKAYVMFVTAFVPDKILCLCLAVAAFQLWRNQQRADLERLRMIAEIFLAFAVLGVGIAILRFPANFAASALYVSFGCWLAGYLRWSKRVQRVFYLSGLPISQ